MGFRCVGCGAWVNRHKCEYCGNEYDDKGRIDNREKCVAGDRTVIARVDKFQPYTEITINEKGVRVATRRVVSVSEVEQLVADGLLTHKEFIDLMGVRVREIEDKLNSVKNVAGRLFGG